jgi:hypothetical protein
MTTKKRLYKIHYNPRKRGNKVIARQKFVTKRAIEVSEIEQTWLAELIQAGYGVCDSLFPEDELLKLIEKLPALPF